jgi:hypothetical protein
MIAVARPIPEPAPVTTAIFPSMRPIVHSPLLVIEFHGKSANWQKNLP